VEGAAIFVVAVIKALERIADSGREGILRLLVHSGRLPLLGRPKVGLRRLLRPFFPEVEGFRMKLLVSAALSSAFQLIILLKTLDEPHHIRGVGVQEGLEVALPLS